MPDRYKAGPLLDGSTAWAIYLAEDPELERPLSYPLYSRQFADDLAAVLNRQVILDSCQKTSN